MARKYYAVRKGRKPGIYRTWDEAKNQVNHYPLAEHKSFKTEAEAQNYMADSNTADSNETTNTAQNSTGLQAYVDGSFNKDKGLYSYGVVLLENGLIVDKLSNADNDPKYAESFQIAGECFGALNAMKWAIDKGYPHISIYFDYIGIEKWAKKEWRANKQVAKDYVRFYDRFSQKINVSFIKVKAHSGIEMNELADQLAKEALQ